MPSQTQIKAAFLCAAAILYTAPSTAQERPAQSQERPGASQPLNENRQERSEPGKALPSQAEPASPRAKIEIKIEASRLRMLMISRSGNSLVIKSEHRIISELRIISGLNHPKTSEPATGIKLAMPIRKINVIRSAIPTVSLIAMLRREAIARGMRGTLSRTMEIVAPRSPTNNSGLGFQRRSGKAISSQFAR